MGKRKKKSTSVTYVYDPNAPEGDATSKGEESQKTTEVEEEEGNRDENKDGPQLSKNKRRKLQKKKRQKELKEQGIVKEKEAVEFTYDPTAAVAALVPKGQELAEETKPSSPLSEPTSEPTEPIEQTPGYNKYRDLVLGFRAPTELSREQEVREFFKTILDLMKKDAVRYFGEEDTSKFHQTELSCGKLFQMLDKKDVSKEILRSLGTIKRKMVMQEYDEAQGVYFQLTIGNAPWPTALGSKSILEDEEKRRTLQAIKRLMTYFQQCIAPKPII